MPNQISPEQAKKLAQFYTGILSSLNSSAALAQSLGGPFLQTYDALKADCNAMLAKLQPTDQAGLALEFDAMLTQIVSAMVGAQSVMGMLWEQLSRAQAELTESGTRVQAQLASAVTVEIEKLVTAGELVRKAALDERISKGELIPREVHTEACSQAKLQGVTEGEGRVRGELEAAARRAQLAGERRQLVETASLALPPAALEAILSEPEEIFTAAKVKADERTKFLNDARISLNSSFRGQVWATDEAWNSTKVAVEELNKLAKGGHEPFTPAPSAGHKRPACSL